MINKESGCSKSKAIALAFPCPLILPEFFGLFVWKNFNFYESGEIW
jgi:hypothetical protein